MLTQSQDVLCLRLLEILGFSIWAYHTVLVKDNGKGSKKDNIWVIVNAQAGLSFGFTMLIHSNILYTAGVLGLCCDVHGEVSVRDTHKADIVRLSGLSVGAVITRIRAKCPIGP